MRTCALNHSDEFLTRHQSKLADWVKSAANANRAEAIYALVSQSHTDDVQDPWHPVALARQAAQVLGPEVSALERACEQTHIEQSSSAVLLTLGVYLRLVPYAIREQTATLTHRRDQTLRPSHAHPTAACVCLERA